MSMPSSSVIVETATPAGAFRNCCSLRSRIVFGLRAHALPAAPIAGLVILGLLAGGALSSGGAM